MFKLVLKNAEEPLDIGIAKIHWIIEKAREFQKKTYISILVTMTKPDCVDHNKLWNILKEMVIPDDLTYLLKNLYVGEDSTVRTRHGTTV